MNIPPIEHFRKFVHFCSSIQQHLIILLMVRFSIKNHHWKADDLSYLKIQKEFLQANCLWSEFAKVSCHKIFLFYSTSYFKFIKEKFKKTYHRQVLLLQIDLSCAMTFEAL